MAEKTTIARPYAQAVFQLARESRSYDAWSRALAKAAQLAVHPQVREVVGSPKVPRAQAVQLFLDLCGKDLDALGQNLVRVLMDNRRLHLLPEIARLYDELRAEAESTLEAEVHTAVELSADQQQRLAAALGKRLDRKVTLACRVDPTLLGGAMIRAGDLVIDGSALGRLNRLATELAG